MADPRSPAVRAAASLATRQGRRRYGRFLVEGPRAVHDLLEATAAGAPYRVHALYVADGVLDRHPSLARLAVPSSIRTATPAVVAAISDASTPQGVVAVVDIPPRRGAAAVELGAGTSGAVLVQVQDPGNVGTVVRAADAAGASVVALTPGCADVHAPKTVRSTAGSLFHLPVVPDVDLGELLTAARGAGVRVLATAAAGDTDLDEAVAAARTGAGPMAAPHLWLLGNEGRGLAAETLAAADDVVRIPLRGRAESLNLAMAATLVLFATARLRSPE
ncbi:MAG: TrmH family RNA methyltransferase [Kineosporiaceae bacterium]